MAESGGAPPVARASSPPLPNSKPHAGWRSRGYLPHLDCPDSTQHIVFRLADALPPGLMTTIVNLPLDQRLDATDKALDAGAGLRRLADPRIAQIVQAALLRFDAERYRLSAWCVMPTHVHVIVTQMEGWPVSAVVHSWKSFTANAANEVLGERGRFWAPEYYDRFMRDEAHFAATRVYVEMNPVAAGLCAAPHDWPWSSAAPR